MAHRVHRPHNFRPLTKPKQLHKSEHRHYLPYIPVLLLVIGTMMLSLAQPIKRRGVLAYATSMSSGALLSETNKERGHHGADDLSLNSELAAAAQAKANDMVARDYWSHTTPDGQQPWVFVDSSGYKYTKAGENLAYGFETSQAAIAGWMHSDSHRENLLDTSFTEVGFGYANSANFNKNGHETIVVAMYGRPQVLAATESPIRSSAQPVTTDTPVLEPQTTAVARAQTWSSRLPAWATFTTGIITGLALMLLLVKHAAGIRHLIRKSEKAVLHHPLLDTVLVSLVLFGTFFTQTSGFIR